MMDIDAHKMFEMVKNGKIALEDFLMWVEARDAQPKVDWGTGVDRMSGAFDDAEILWYQKWR